MISAAPATTSPSLPTAGLRDFSDRLSPMLVKELRQGLKSHVFTWGLIAMQLALIIMAVVSMEDGNSRDTNTAFWWSVAGPICLLLPMRLANALRDESGGNTLDTLLLTQLSAWRIALGKWLATCALQVLVAMTALPYLILRYFSGGVNMPLEVAWLGIYVVMGMVTSAVMLGMSWFPHFLLRAAIMLAVLAAAAGFCGGTIDEISRANNYGIDEAFTELRWPGTIFALLLTAWVTFYFLDLGAARLAPVSENRATRRRLVALAVLGIGGACCFGKFPDRDTAPVMAMMLGMGMVLPAIQAICERPANYAPVLQPFVRRGPAGRLAGRVLYPGWHTGLVFALLILLVASGLAFWHFWVMLNLRRGVMVYEFFDEYRLMILASSFGGCIGLVIMPLVAWRIFKGLAKWDFWRWLLVLLVAGVFHFVVTLTAYRTSSKVMFASYLLPSGCLFVAPAAEIYAEEVMPWERGFNSSKDWDKFYREREKHKMRYLWVHGTVALSSLGLWLAAAVIITMKEMRVTRRAEQELA